MCEEELYGVRVIDFFHFDQSFRFNLSYLDYCVIAGNNCSNGRDLVWPLVSGLALTNGQTCHAKQDYL